MRSPAEIAADVGLGSCLSGNELLFVPSWARTNDDTVAAIATPRARQMSCRIMAARLDDERSRFLGRSRKVNARRAQIADANPLVVVGRTL